MLRFQLGGVILKVCLSVCHEKYPLKTSLVGSTTIKYPLLKVEVREVRGGWICLMRRETYTDSMSA